MHKFIHSNGHRAGPTNGFTVESIQMTADEDIRQFKRKTKRGAVVE